VVTPCYNQKRFVEQTIRSVLCQNYPNLEYIIIDGGSTDNSVEIIKKYEKHLAYWVSEKDRGQSHAINKGFAKTTGGILSWLNSDDIYNINAFSEAAKWYISSPDYEWMVGACQLISEDGLAIKLLKPRVSVNPAYFMAQPFAIGKKNQPECPQPSTFLKRHQWLKTGSLNETLNFAMDYEYWIRLTINGFKPKPTHKILSNFRIHAESKTMKENGWFLKEQIGIIYCHMPKLPLFERLIMRWRLHKHHCQQVAFCAGHEIKHLPFRGKWQRIIKESFKRPILLIHRPWIGLIRKILIGL